MKRILLTSSLCLLASPAFGYKIRTTAGGAPLRWPAGAIAIELALDDAPQGISTQDATAAAQRAFGAYVAVISPMAPSITVDMQSRSGRPAAESSDRIATVVWVADGWDDDYDPNALAVTKTTYDTSSGRIDDADIVINSSFPWTGKDDCQDAYDLQSVLTHEVGHLFGLGHDNDDEDATMYPSAGTCETKKRDLDGSDVDGLHFLYVDVTAPPPTACQVVPGGGPLSDAIWWVLGTFGVAWRRRLGAAMLVLTGLFSTARATTMKKLGLEAAGKSAAVVARGTVRAETVRRVNGRVYTDAELVVDQCLKGICGKTLTIRQLGGELDGEGLSILGNAELGAGSEVVVMLRTRRDGTFAPVGMAQGVLRVERDARGATRALVRDTSGLVFAGELSEGAPAAAGKVERLTLEELERALADDRGDRK